MPSNTYGAIPTNVTPVVSGSIGSEEGSSNNRKGFIALTVGLMIVVCLFGTGGSPQDANASMSSIATTANTATTNTNTEAEHWPPALYKINKVKFPTSTLEAEEMSWKKSDEPCDPLLGEAWVFGGEKDIETPVSLYFTPAVGASEGRLSGIEVDVYDGVEEELVGVYFTEEKDAKDGSYHSLSLALREGDLCNTDVPVSPGNPPYMVLSPGLAATAVPLKETDPEVQANWREGTCIRNMGYHWATDIVGGKDLTWEAKNLVPIVPMYASTGDTSINAVFFVTTGKKQHYPEDCAPFSESDYCVANSNWWDSIPGLAQANVGRFYMCTNFCGEDCRFHGAYQDYFTTMHWYFTDVWDPETGEFCTQDPNGGGPPFCRSGEYPIKED